MQKKVFLIVFQLENQYKQMFCSWLAKKISIFLGSTYRVEISSSHWKNRSQHGNKLWTDKVSEMSLPPFLCINSINFIPSLWHWEVVFWHLLSDLIFWVWEYRKKMKHTDNKEQVEKIKANRENSRKSVGGSNNLNSYFAQMIKIWLYRLLCCHPYFNPLLLL